MGVVIQEFEVSPAATPAPAAAAPTPDSSPSDTPAGPRPADAQRLTVERRERALRVFAH